MTGFEPRPETVEKAKRAACARCTHEDIGDCDEECNDIAAALAAVLPDVVADVRAEIAEEIETRMAHIHDERRPADRCPDGCAWLAFAAAVARGEQAP